MACREVEAQPIQNKCFVKTPGTLIFALLGSSLSADAKLLYVVADMLAAIEGFHTGKRTLVQPAKYFATLFGTTTSKIFRLQKELEQAGFFLIVRSMQNNRCNRNQITPTLPDALFSALQSEPNRYGMNPNPVNEPEELVHRRQYLDETKLFVRLNYARTKEIFSRRDLKNPEKMLWLYLTAKGQVVANESNGEGVPAIHHKQTELAALLNCSVSTVSRAIQTLIDKDLVIANKVAALDKTTKLRADKTFWTLRLKETIVELPGKPQVKQKATVQKLPVKEKAAMASFAQVDYQIAQMDNINSKYINNKYFLNNFKQEHFLELNYDKVLLDKAQEILKYFDSQVAKMTSKGLNALQAREIAVKTIPVEDKQALSTMARVAYQDISAQIKTLKAQGVRKITHEIKKSCCQVKLRLFDEIYQNGAPLFDKSVLQKPKVAAPVLTTALQVTEQIPPTPSYGLALVPLIGQSKATFLQKRLQAMRNREEVRGIAQQFSQAELTEQVAFYAKTFQPRFSPPDKIGLGIHIACEKIKQGQWQIPFGLAEAKEADWQRQKQQLREVKCA